MRLPTKKYLVFLTAAQMALASCSSPPIRAKAAVKSSSDSSSTETKTSTQTQVSVLPLSDDEAMKFLSDNCSSCHASGKPMNSFWPMPDKLTKEMLAVDQFAPTVYQALLNNSKGNSSSKPSPMPPSKAPEKLENMLAWFAINLPAVKHEAEVVYQAGENTTQFVENYKCNEVVSFRKYLTRITNDAFDRQPTEAELKLGGENPDVMAQKEMRANVAKRIFEDKILKAEFMEKGLKKFARKFSGADDIDVGGPINSDTAYDLKEEFYETLKNKIESESFKDILLSDEVMVSRHTYKLYEECEEQVKDVSFAVTPYVPCKMTSPRGSYFTTAGYLRAKPTSFLQANNNYGRVALMHFTINGDVLKPATDGPTGGEVRDLPQCLKSNDWRGTKQGDNVAPFGAMKIPSSGNLCQSCHISRFMAAGSILFRPYSSFGSIFKSEFFTEENVVKENELKNALLPELVNQVKNNEPEKVTLEFLKSLAALDSSQENACVTASGEKEPTNLKNVKELAEKMIGDGRPLARGLARHLPRALSNVGTTNQEVFNAIDAAYRDGKGKLLPVFEAYFTTETYACKAEE